MFCEMIDKSYIVDMSGTSEGTQIKYYKDGFWYKEDSYGGEANAEYLASGILSFSNLKKSEYVEYDYGTVNAKTACRSENFLENGEDFITLYRYYELTVGRKINEDILQYESPQKRADFVLNFFMKACGLDLSDYFSKIFTLDYLILNEDRHFNNLGIISTVDGRYKSAPIFDNGKSLLVGNPSVNRKLPISENVKRVIARPFSGSHKVNKELFGSGFSLNMEGLLGWLTEQEDSYEKSVLTFLLTEEKL